MSDFKKIKKLIDSGDIPLGMKELLKLKKRSFLPIDLTYLLADIYVLSKMDFELEALLEESLVLNEKKPEFHLEVIQYLHEKNKVEIAGKFIKNSRRRFPMHLGLLTELAKNNMLLNDTDKASHTFLTKAKIGKFENSDYTILCELLGKLKIKSNLTNHETEFSNNANVKKILLAKVYENSVSLGFDCELGFIQRLRGFEPTDLFRWGTLPFDQLIRLIESRFQGFSTEESSYVEYENTESFHEYWFFDREYKAKIHTGFRMGNISVDDDIYSVFKKSRMHFSMLARRLREDFEDGEKLFVYKSEFILKTSEIERLAAVINSYGKNKILIIMKLGEQSYDFMEFSDSVAIGFLREYWKDGKHQTISFDDWDKIMHKTNDYFKLDFGGESGY
ncbi:hypothetical protein ICN46_11655 [Polynucleobacter sp. Latsch14-2]|jgi:hypothetical protein|uniref:hypothetical protein n=1 Tax=Polynucleobacter sp. Latsch14-2 TaxID=2576920 RepID=UPI001C0E151A|nr:hypothetical protein [Polynucleobacter sp. Latsch14-2]MBU3615545.1 hypothetical protein [Polynucleobacter sp. Latsch14-2]